MISGLVIRDCGSGVRIQVQVHSSLFEVRCSWFERNHQSRIANQMVSRQHPIVRRFRELARTPDPTGAQLLLDGIHLIRDAAAAGVELEVIAIASSWKDADGDPSLSPGVAHGDDLALEVASGEPGEGDRVLAPAAVGPVVGRTLVEQPQHGPVLPPGRVGRRHALGPAGWGVCCHAVIVHA